MTAVLAAFRRRREEVPAVPADPLDSDEDRRVLAALDENASAVYLAWRGIGYPWRVALTEVEKLGLWTDPAMNARLFRRQVQFWAARVGNTASTLRTIIDEMPRAARLLADWQLIKPAERDFLKAVASGATFTPQISPTDAQEVLEIDAASAAELYASRVVDVDAYGQYSQTVRIGRGLLPEPPEGDRGVTAWWRKAVHPPYHYASERR